MSQEEELVELSQVVGRLKDRVADLEELIIDWMLFMHKYLPFTWNKGEDGMLLQERIRELGIVEKEQKHE